MPSEELGNDQRQLASSSLLECLPDEMLEMILTQALPDIENFKRPQSMKSRNSEILLTSPILQTSRKLRRHGLDVVNRAYVWISLLVLSCTPIASPLSTTESIWHMVSNVPDKFRYLLQESAIRARIIFSGEESQSQVHMHDIVFPYDYYAFASVMEDLAPVVNHLGRPLMLRFECENIHGRAKKISMCSSIGLIDGYSDLSLHYLRHDLCFNGKALDPILVSLMTTKIRNLTNRQVLIAASLSLIDELETLRYQDQADRLLIAMMQALLHLGRWALPVPLDWERGESPPPMEGFASYVFDLMGLGRNANANHLRRLLFKLSIRTLVAYVSLFKGETALTGVLTTSLQVCP